MSAERLESIRSLFRNSGDDALLITAPEDVRWACGFTGSSGALLVRGDGTTLFTDGRYTTQATAEVNGIHVETCSGDLVTAIGKHPHIDGLERIAIDGSLTSVANYRRMQSWPGGHHIRPYDSPLSSLVAVKSDEEILRMKHAQGITDAVFEEILSIVKPALSERELAAEIVFRHLDHGAERVSFDPIVASGPNGALPHARPTDRRLAKGDMVVLDFDASFKAMRPT